MQGVLCRQHAHMAPIGSRLHNRQRMAAPLRLSSHLTPRARLRPQHSRMHSSAGPAPGPSVELDFLSNALQHCGTMCVSAANVVVDQLSDALESLVPQETPRHKVELSVKGSLVLVMLALFKSMLSFVLVLGALVLGFYTATQVFGWGTSPAPQQQGYYGPYQPPPHNGQPGPKRPTAQQPPYSNVGGRGRGYAGRGAPPYGSSYQGNTGSRPNRQPVQPQYRQGDVIDVFWGPAPAS